MAGLLFLLTVILTFYSAYKDSSSIKDISNSGVWKLLYRVTSSIGYYIYCLEIYLKALLFVSFIYKYKKVYDAEQITDDLILDSLHTSQIRLPVQIIYLLYSFINIFEFI